MLVVNGQFQFLEVAGPLTSDDGDFNRCPWSPAASSQNNTGKPQFSGKIYVKRMSYLEDTSESMQASQQGS